MRSVLIFCMAVTMFSCQMHRIGIPGQRYSTGHMGMPGENVFVFKDNNSFCYYERLGYSEGTFVWISKNKIRLTSKVMGFDIPYKEERWLKDLTNKEAIFKGNRLFFEGFGLRLVKE